MQARADVVIDAWVKQRDVQRNYHAELFDQASILPDKRQPLKLAMPDPPAVVIAKKTTLISAAAAGKRVIGAIEVDAKLYPLEISGDFTNVLPANLMLLAPDGGRFWVKTADLP